MPVQSELRNRQFWNIYFAGGVTQITDKRDDKRRPAFRLVPVYMVGAMRARPPLLGVLPCRTGRTPSLTLTSMSAFPRFARRSGIADSRRSAPFESCPQNENIRNPFRDYGYFDLVGARGFEPPAPASRTRCSTRLSHAPISKKSTTHKIHSRD